ncbi:MAG: biopolymer transporter ExbD [Chlamydiae bacterium]|nr:biopolymer transporter ExbD [Chlamydiota bacterium]
MANKRRFMVASEASDEASPNLTPLIDVVFVVLIMFIIIAPMLDVDHIKLADAPSRDQSQFTSVQEVSSITIHVHADDSIWLNTVRVMPEDLLSLLRSAQERTPSKTPQLFQDKKASFGTYQMIKNAVELSGFQELDVILQPG